MRIVQHGVASDDQPPVAGVTIQEASSIFHAIGVDAAGQGTAGAVARLLASAAADVLSSGAERATWPAALAARIADRLAAKSPGDPGWILFAAALVTAEVVHVCTAGDVRIRLVRGGSLLRVTRDHILANESPDWVRMTYGDIDVDTQGSVLTRSLGACQLPPESDIWPVKPPFSVLLGWTESGDRADADPERALASIDV